MTETTSKAITANIGGRSPLKHHGILGDKGETGVIYASMPMALARAKLKPAAKTVAVLIWSHSEGWELSIASLAEDSGMTRKTVGKAVEELQAARWLVRQPYGQPGKKPAGEVWHIQLTNLPFTGAQVEELSQLVPIATGGNTLSTPGESFLPTAGESFLPTAGESLLLTKVVDLPEVDLQAVQDSSSASLPDQSAAATEGTAEEKEEPASSLAALEDPRFQAIYETALKGVNQTMDTLQAQERAHTIAMDRYQDVLAQDAVIQEGKERRKALWDSMPDWVTDAHKQAARDKRRTDELPGLVQQVLNDPNVRVKGAVLMSKIRALTDAPKTVAGRLWQE